VNICFAATLSWALLWHVPANQHPRLILCFAERADCEAAADVANEAFRLGGLAIHDLVERRPSYRAECAPQSAPREKP
jgi:hypothetical protein